MTAASNVAIKSAGVLTGAASDATLMGTTYRAAEAQLHSQLLAGLQALTAGLTALGAGLAAAAPLTPLAAVPLAAAAAGATAAIASVTVMTAALTAFEAQAPTYLSLKNKSD